MDVEVYVSLDFVGVDVNAGVEDDVEFDIGVEVELTSKLK